MGRSSRSNAEQATRLADATQLPPATRLVLSQTALCAAQQKTAQGITVIVLTSDAPMESPHNVHNLHNGVCTLTDFGVTT
jgi:hypothetical protein